MFSYFFQTESDTSCDRDTFDESVSDKMQISVFQALTCLIQTYQGDAHHRATYEQAKGLYLSGVQKKVDMAQLNSLMQDESLSEYAISSQASVINDDPVRRYFESQLAYETLRCCLETLELDTLRQHYESLLAYKGIRPEILEEIDAYWDEHKRVLQRLQRDPLQAGSVLKKAYFLYAIYWWCVAYPAQPSPSLFKYDRDLFHDRVRGRQKIANSHSGAKPAASSQLGIMKSYMPLPSNDRLQTELTHDRHYVYKYTYAGGALQPKLNFFNAVTPFVGSISGCMWRQFLVIETLHKKNAFVYGEHPEQLKNYVRCFTAFGVFFLGNHTLNECISVLQLPQVQYAFQSLSGFSSMTMDNLFKVENEAAFTRALDKTLLYNTNVLNRAKVHDAICKKPVVAPHTFEPVNLSDFIIHRFTGYEDLDYGDLDDEELDHYDHLVKGHSKVIRASDPNALLWVVLRGDHRLLQFLIAFGADVNASISNNTKRYTALDLALFKGYLIAASMLREAGAVTVNSKPVDSPTPDIETPLPDEAVEPFNLCTIM